MEEALGGFSSVQVYQARVFDYLTASLEQDAPEVERLIGEFQSFKQDFDDRLARGEITKEYYNERVISQEKWTAEQLESFMTEDKANTLADEIADLIAKGTPPEQIPLFAESQGIEGVAVMDLYNQGLVSAEQRFREEQAKIPEWKGYPEDIEAPIQTGTEERDYYTIIQGLGLAYEVEQYMMGRFEEFRGQWMQTGPSMPFVDWLRIEMGG